MKRVLSLLLCLSVLLGCQFQVFAYDVNDVPQLLEFMHALGIMGDYDAESFATDQKVTRAMFADNVVELLGENGSKSEKVYYHDVSKDYWAFESIGRLTEIGIINGNDSQLFNPEKVITKAETAKIMLFVLGYGEYAVSQEEYPQGYIRLANDLKLFDKCSGGNEITMLDMLHIFRNALETEIVELSLEHGGLTYEKSDKTLLEQYYEMYFGKGTVTGCERVNLSSGERIEEGKIYIDGVEYETNLTGLIDYLGCSVEFIYEEDDYGDYSLIWLKSSGKSDILKLSVDVEKVFDSNEYVLRYVKENTNSYKNLKIARNINVVYNGAYVKDGIESIFEKDKYSVTFVGNGGEYSLAIVEAYENFLVSDVDSDRYVIYDKLSGNKSISLDEDDWESVEIIKNGSKSTFSDINRDDVVSLFKSYDEKSIKAVVSSTIASGTVKSVENDNGDVYVTLDDETYKFYEVNASDNIRVGDSVRLRLDFNGYIAEISVSIGNEAVAYLLRARVDQDSDELNLKLLTKAGIETYKCATKLSINGQRADDLMIANELTGIDGKTVQRLLVVFFNSEKKINKIYTPDQSTNSDFKLYLTESNGRYRTSIGKLGKKILIDDETMIFAVPSTYSQNEEDFAFKTKKNLVEDKNYATEVYRYRTENLEFEDILVMKDADWHQSYDWEGSILVNKITTTLNSDDEVVECLEGYKGNSYVKAITDGKYSLERNGIKSGDVIKIQCDAYGNIDGANIVYSYGGASRPITSDYNASYRIATVYAHDKIGNALKVGYSNGSDFDEVFNLSGTTIMVYDPDEVKEKIRQGSIEDIRTYKTSGSNCSTVVVQTNYMTPVMVVVYANNR